MMIYFITSTSFMTATGLKKCRPPNLSPLFVTLAISVMERDEVLLANIVELQREREIKGGGRIFEQIFKYLGAILSSFEKRSFFMSIFSIMASTRRSQSPLTDSSVFTVYFIRDIV